MTTWLILTRAVHFGVCLLFFGIFAFDRLVAVSIFSNGQFEIAAYWKSRMKIFSLVLSPIIFMSGLAWFALVAVTVSGQPLQVEILKTVWTQTHFGTVWKIRFIFWLAAAVVAVCFYSSKSQTTLQKIFVRLQLFSGGCLLGSLAWAGHGMEGSRWHLSADILHLLVAGFWPTGLLPLVLLLKKFRQTSEPVRWQFIAALVRRFSAMSLAAVSLLAATGFVNGFFLVGSFSNLFGQTYGRILLLKIVFFIFAVAIGAVNLLRLRPRFLIKTAQTQIREAAAAQLQFNVRAELILGAGIIVVVAILGILPPAIH